MAAFWAGDRGGWFAAERNSVEFRVNAQGPVASVGRGAISGEGFVLEVPEQGGVAIAAWPRLRSGMAEVPLLHCDCVPNRYDADIRLVWRRADRPGAIFNAPIEHELGQTELLDLAQHPDWGGPINGIAIAYRGYPGDTLLIRGLSAQSGSLANRLRLGVEEWSGFRPWDGQSINLVIVGARERNVSPVLLIAILIALGLCSFYWTRPARPDAVVVLLLAAVAGWIILDARWEADLYSKVAATIAQYGSKPIEERWRSSADGDIYLLAASVKREVADPAQRIFVFGDEAFARGRAAYHLLPLSVHYDAYGGALPNARYLRPGDLVFVAWSRRVRFDDVARQLIWEGGRLPVELVAKLRGNAVYRVLP